MQISKKNLDLTPTLTDSKIEIAKLEPSDFAALYVVAADELLWQGHPSKDRYKKENFEKWFSSALDSHTALKIKNRANGNLIGSTRYYDYIPGSEISIGYTFIDRKFWGGETNRRVKQLMIDHAFKNVERIWFHIAPSNIRSQKATEKLGAIKSHSEKKQLSGGIEEYYCYLLDRELTDK
jgi:RimJ/RimL family protein N-acetyltransferase